MNSGEFKFGNNGQGRKRRLPVRLTELPTDPVPKKSRSDEDQLPSTSKSQRVFGIKKSSSDSSALQKTSKVLKVTTVDAERSGKLASSGHRGRCPQCGCNLHIDCDRSTSDCALFGKKKDPCAPKKGRKRGAPKRKKAKRPARKCGKPRRMPRKPSGGRGCKPKGKPKVNSKACRPKVKPKINKCESLDLDDVASLPFLNFLTVYCREYCDIPQTEAVRLGAEEWDRMTKEQQNRYDFSDV